MPPCRANGNEVIGPISLQRSRRIDGQPHQVRARLQELVVGGALDSARAASHGAGGGAMIVAALSGPVSTPRTDVNFVVTEHGFADLRGATQLTTTNLPPRRMTLLAKVKGFVCRCTQPRGLRPPHG
jgi:hypothetical protein